MTILDNSVKFLIPLALLALAGCATPATTPFSPVRDFQYGALGHDPFWMVAIGNDQIVLPREVDGARRWESGEGTQVIAIEARPADCTAGGRRYEDRVTVTLSGRMLQGCGGRELAESHG